ncbi:MAG: NAD(P)H-dependent glycerol-3-phosphate dehydrogenase [Planctomycetota bacterium]|nr:NAD(P)H-dependent glycerol-3-phosphate dehydrogenase [Planctomycetota bacterium]
MPQSVFVLGDGGWGTAIAMLMAKNGHKVRLWSVDEQYARQVARTRENRKFLPGVRVSDQVAIVWDTSALADAAMMVMAVPTQFARAVLSKLAPSFPRQVEIVSVAKGIENDTLLRPSQVIRDVLGRVKVGVLSGPSHAEEVARGLPASVVAAAADDSFASRIQALFMGERFRVYTNTDEVGVELGGALKNVIAIAAGMCDGMKLGDNTKSALLARGLVEMERLGVALGARRSTFTGLAGIGDLVTTCVSPFGRNREVGLKIGQGMKLAEVLKSMEKVAEGVWTTKSVHSLAKKQGVRMPIAEEVYAVLFEDKPSQQALKDLMTRRAKSEEEDL